MRDNYGRYCPVAMGSDVLADRWTPLIMRELILGSVRFNEIARGLPGISRSLLVKRLKHLERCGVLMRWPSPSGQGSEYHLTPAGKDLEQVVMALGRWSVEWQYDELRADDVDVVTLTWWMHHRVDVSALPAKRVVVQFDHTGPDRQTIWMVLEPSGASVCVNHPGVDADVLVTTTTPSLADVFSGRTTWPRAQRDGTVRVDGLAAYVKAIPRWLQPSPFAPEMARVTASRAMVG